jgi:hypothetical protein
VYSSGVAAGVAIKPRSHPESNTLIQLAFESKALRTICEDAEQTRRELGPIAADVLKRRLADLRSCTSIRDLLAGHPRIAADGNLMVVDLADEYKLILQANHPKNPLKEDGNVDWTRVVRIKILAIGRDHV